MAIFVVAGPKSGAAPILPKPHKLHDQMRSLAKLKRIALKIEPMPAEVRVAGVTAAKIRRSWSKRLEQAGFELAEGEGDPVLSFKISTITDKAVPHGVAFNPYLALSQPVRIDGIDGYLAVPTFVEIVVGLETEEKLGPVVEQQAQQMLDNFIRRWEEAAASK